jgi:transposase-like protein
LEDLKRRGLSDPLLVVTDGAPGLIRTVTARFVLTYPVKY